MLNKQYVGDNSRILVVDDNPANVKLLEKILHINGFVDVKTLMDSREVLRVYSEYKPDLLLLDLKMPYVDGFDILEGLKETNNSDYVPVIVISAQDDMTNRLKALELGAQDFIGKPFNHSEVALKVSNYLYVKLYNNDIRAQNIILESEVQEKKQELNEMQHELIERLLRAAEFRDQETGNHIVRIKKYAFLIANAMGLSEDDSEEIAFAGLMHDIGKIGVSDEILNKPGKLNASEWESMMAHTTKGGEILSGSSSKIISLAEQIALSHHEKWDGSGYPNKLVGTQIPLSARIIALVDVFDALLSDRPYKEAWSVEKTVNYIVNQRSVHFDPAAVDAFLNCLPELIKIKEQLA